MFKLEMDKQAESIYIESAQTNPIRWQLFHREGKTLTPQTYKMKCRDFFNDFVALKRGKAFTVYRLNTSEIKMNGSGMYVYVSNLANKKQFLQNLKLIKECFNQQMNSDLRFLTLPYKRGVLIKFPETALKSTWTMSLLTLLIRISNYDIAFKTWDDFFGDKSPFQTTEYFFRKDYQNIAKQYGFLPPEAFQKYWWYAGENYNSERIPPSEVTRVNSWIHNSGIVSWINAIRASGVKL